jgi:histidine phosphotransferase ChpT
MSRRAMERQCVCRQLLGEAACFAVFETATDSGPLHREAGLSGELTLSDLDLAALLCSRVCHDVISPVGAIANGLEVLEDEDDESMKKMAMELVRKSARQAAAKLQFCRIAFGAAGSVGALIDLGEAGDIAKAFMSEEKVKLDWQAPRETRPKSEVKLLLNLMLLGITTIPRGGTVTVGVEGSVLSVQAAGEGAKVPEKVAQLLAGQLDPVELDARLVQPYYTQRLSADCGFMLRITSDGERVSYEARRENQAAA